MASIGRNAPCPCGSGKKYKRCCALKANQPSISARIAASLIGLVLLAGALFFIISLRGDGGDSVGTTRVWHGDHWDYPGQTH